MKTHLSNFRERVATNIRLRLPTPVTAKTKRQNLGGMMGLAFPIEGRLSPFGTHNYTLLDL